MTAPLQKAAKHLPAARQEALRLQAEGGCGPGTGRGPQAPGQAGGPDRMEEGVGQADGKGFQDIHLLDGLLVRGRQDAQCAPGERREDGCRGGQAEGQGDESGGAEGPSYRVRMISIIEKIYAHVGFPIGSSEYPFVASEFAQVRKFSNFYGFRKTYKPNIKWLNKCLTLI